jgi:hypothetical protein
MKDIAKLPFFLEGIAFHMAACVVPSILTEHAHSPTLVCSQRYADTTATMVQSSTYISRVVRVLPVVAFDGSVRREVNGIDCGGNKNYAISVKGKPRYF